jgi:glycine/D-amino acid oxidase-like deaminating enzyme
MIPLRNSSLIKKIGYNFCQHKNFGMSLRRKMTGDAQARCFEGGGGPHPAHKNLWEETAVGAPSCPGLDQSVSADVAIIGAGYLGLSAALHLAQGGANVVVLDAHEPGWGASGRNGGQIIPGLKYDPDELEAIYGREAGERIVRFAGATADFVFDLVGRHGLDAGARRSAWVQGVHSARAAVKARRRAEQWRRRGADVDFIDAAKTAAIVGAPLYVGAFIDRRAGALQPLSYARELARVALVSGARIHGSTRAVAISRDGRGFKVLSDRGAAVVADMVLVCTNAYSDALVPGLARSIVAANSLQVATEPLPQGLRSQLLPNGEVLSDTRKVIRYWRLDDAGRFIMGGRGPYREPAGPGDWMHLRRDAEAFFPMLKHVRFTHRWGGRVAIHRDFLPHLHNPAPGLLVAIGCQGRGVAWQTAMGAELARMALNSGHEPILPLRPIEPMPFHRFKAAGVSATVALYRAMDRLGWS